MSERRYILHPNDANQDWRIAKLALEGLRQAAREARRDQRPKEIVIRDYQPPRTDPQRRTLWLWHTEVASELTLRTGRKWDKNDVHEAVFLPRWMPQRELVTPDGEIVYRQMRTSDKPPQDDQRSTKQIVSEAMTQYLAWIYSMGIEITVPEHGW